jgi:hypothetical protein
MVGGVIMDPKRSAVRRAMQKQAKVSSVYEAITREMLTIANEAAVNWIAPAKADTSYGYAGAHIEGEIYSSTLNENLDYALDVYWTGKKGVVAIVMYPPAYPGDSVNDDIEFSGRDKTARVVKKARDLLYRLRDEVS